MPFQELCCSESLPATSTISPLGVFTPVYDIGQEHRNGQNKTRLSKQTSPFTDTYELPGIMTVTAVGALGQATFSNQGPHIRGLGRLVA